METFDLINNFNQKRAMLLAAAKSRGFDKSVLAPFKVLLKNLQDANDSRILAAHGKWGLAKTIPDALVWIKTVGQMGSPLVYTEADFEAELQKIEKALYELHAFFVVTLLPVLKTRTEEYVAAVQAAKNIRNSV